MKVTNNSKNNFKDIALLVGGLVYFVCPTDLIPDVIAGVGYTDDLAALTLVFKSAIGIFTNSDICKANEKAAKLLGKNFDAEKAAQMTKMIIDSKKE